MKKIMIQIIKPIKFGQQVFSPGERREVIVMVEKDGYAMVRRKGCMPYVVPLKELEPQES